MIVEIPKGENAKLEISTAIPLNPILHDIKKGKLRYIHWSYPCNYGALPQTWENPLVEDKNTKMLGDNDPVDVCEISDICHCPGDVVKVKILGAYAMIDEGETDWKVVAVDIKDPNINDINDINDVQKVYPGRLTEIFSFLKYYKTPTGAKPNVFAFDEKPLDKNFALSIIEETHENWRKLITQEIPNKTKRYNISCMCTEQNSPYQISNEEAEVAVAESYRNYLRGNL